MEDYSKVTELFGEKSKVTELKNGRRFTISQGDIEAFYKGQGVDKTVLKKLRDIDKGIVNGAHAFGGAQLVEKINEAKAAGATSDELAGLKVEVVVNTMQGPSRHAIYSRKEYYNKFDPDNKVVHYGDMKISHKRTRLIDKESAAKIQAEIAKAMK